MKSPLHPTFYRQLSISPETSLSSSRRKSRWMSPEVNMRNMAWLLLVLLALGCMASAQSTQASPKFLSCGENGPLCTEVYDAVGYDGAYTGHDEPSLLFYSNVHGSGNTSIYLLQLPKDPPRLPKQDATGGTFNFQLHPAFWVGMAICDDQSAPNPGGSSISPNRPCTPDSDKNISDGLDPTKPDYVGKHPGGAFMEMQFYPPGWILWPPGNSCDGTRWCAALNIDSLSQNFNTGQNQNEACIAAAGLEYVNFAFITKSGVAHAPASPLLATGDTFTPSPKTDLFMNSGDVLRIVVQDTADGLKITIDDLTSGESGSMTASKANGFAEVLFDPKGTNCDPKTHNIPTNFHPMYATSSEHTRVPWAAHSYNIAFSDEIGHFEYCSGITDADLHNSCPSTGGDPRGSRDVDDNYCFGPLASSRVQIGGCFGFLSPGGLGDFEFDGVSYQLVWPGTFNNPGRDRSLHAQPVRFTSPLFIAAEEGELNNYSRVAFEANMPRIELATNPPCHRHVSNPSDPDAGKGCVNPPLGAEFYPIYTTAGLRHEEEAEGENVACVWQLGGAHIPGTRNTFGGNSTAEFGTKPLALAYAASNGQPEVLFEDFRRVLDNNPCRQ
jgi:hypothetical protein